MGARIRASPGIQPARGRIWGMMRPSPRSSASRPMISSAEQNRQKVTIFYSGGDLPKPAVATMLVPTVSEMVWTMGGGKGDGFSFSYADIVGVLRAMTEKKDILAGFVMQDLPSV